MEYGFDRPKASQTKTELESLSERISLLRKDPSALSAEQERALSESDQFIRNGLQNVADAYTAEQADKDLASAQEKYEAATENK